MNGNLLSLEHGGPGLDMTVYKLMFCALGTNVGLKNINKGNNVIELLLEVKNLQKEKLENGAHSL